MISNYLIAHQENNVKNNNEQTFNEQWPYHSYLYPCTYLKYFLHTILRLGQFLK